MGVAWHVATLSQDCLQRNAWVCWDYVTSRSDQLADATREHLYLTVVSMLVAVAIAVPLGLLAHRRPRLRPLVLGAATLLYTIPSLALFSLLLPITKLSTTTVVIGLVTYALAILVANVVAGLDGVSADVLDSARGMGMSARQRFWKVELPLAVPTLLGGIRVATVSTVALATVGTIVGHGGLGDLIFQGLRSNFKAQVLTATVLVVALALLLDLLLALLQRLLTPWERGSRRRRPVETLLETEGVAVGAAAA